MIQGDPLLLRNPDGTQGSVLSNRFGVTEQYQLDRLEAAVTALSVPALRARLSTLPEGPSPEPVLDRLKDIHKEMFGALYDWAGETREVNIAKRDPVTREVTRFEYIASLGTDPAKVSAEDRGAAKEEFAYLGSKIDNWLAEQAPPKTPEQLAERLSGMFQRLNDLHPFREGNGRAIRELLRDEAHRHGSALVLDNITRADWISASVAAHGGKSAAMTQLMQASLVDHSFQKAADAKLADAGKGHDMRAGMERAAQVLKERHGLSLTLPEVTKVAIAAARAAPDQLLMVEHEGKTHKVPASDIKQAVIQGAISRQVATPQAAPPSAPPRQTGRER